MLSNILPSYAGDPVPGIDVSLEQIPGGYKNVNGRPSFVENDLGKITVSSPSDNLSDTVPDTIKAYIFSSDDPKGLPVTLMETTMNSGIFVGEFSIGSGSTDGKSRTSITISPVSTVYVEYNGVRTNGFVEGDPAYAKNYNSSRSNVSYRDTNSGDTSTTLDPDYAKSASRGIVVGKGGDARVLSDGETEKIGSIILKLQTMLSQSNNPDALKLLSELGDIWNKPADVAMNEKTYTPQVGDEVFVAKEKDVNTAKAEDIKKAEAKALATKAAEAKKLAAQKTAEAKKLATQKTADAKKGLNAVEIKTAITSLKGELKANAKGLKSLQGLENAIKTAKINADGTIDQTGINKAMSELKKELTASKSPALKSLKTLEDAIAKYSRFGIGKSTGS